MVPQAPQAKVPGRCIFCGRFGLTKEHLWANWLRAYLPRKTPHHVTRTVVLHPGAPDQIAHQRRNGDFYARRIRCVCGRCNNGWMSRLQSSAKPFLVPLLKGEPTTLHKRARRIIATWTAMMVTVGEYASRECIAIPQSDRDFLMKEQKPPSHWRIWLGAHNCQDFPLYSHNTLALAEEEIEGFPDDFFAEPNTQTTTICLGEHLVIYVMSSIVARDYIRRWVLPPPISPYIDQIWPIGIRASAVRWPPSKALNDRGLALLANHFFDRGCELAVRN